MRIDQLEYFLAVAKSGSLNVASERLFMTPQALGMAIKALEKELNVALLKRAYNGVTLTDEGEQMLPLAEEIIERVNKMRRFQVHAASQVRPLTGSMRIFTTPLVDNLFVSPTIHRFLKENGQVSAAVVEWTLSDFMQELDELNFDLGIIHTAMHKEAIIPQKYLQEFVFETIYSGKLSICCHKNHPLAAKRVVSWKMAREYPLLMVNENNLADFAVLELAEKYGEPQSMTMFSNINLCIEGLKERQDALALTLPFVTPAVKEELRIIPLRENILIAVLMISRSQDVQSEAVMAYREALKGYITHRQ